MKQQIAETLENELSEVPPEDGRKVDVQECRVIKPLSPLSSPLEELDKCSTTINLKEKTEEFNLKEDSKLKGVKSCKSDVICTLYKTKETPQLSRKDCSVVRNI